MTGWPTVYAAGDSSDPFGNMLYYGGWDGDNNHKQNLTSFQIDDNVTWIKGKHTCQVRIQRTAGIQQHRRDCSRPKAPTVFTRIGPQLYDPAAQGAAPFTGTGFGSLLLGLPTALRNQYNRGYFYFRQKEFGLYVDDTWKVTPRLTIRLGLRWDHWNPYKEKYDRLVNLDPANFPGFTVITPHNTTLESYPGHSARSAGVVDRRAAYRG